jgi:hypothetical protein
VYMAAFTPEEEEWFLDLGATPYIIGNCSLIMELEPSPIPSIKLVGSQTMPVAAKGNVKIIGITGEIKNVKNVLYVLGVHINLFFVDKFIDMEHLVLFNSQRCYIFKKDKLDTIVLQAIRDPRNKLY